MHTDGLAAACADREVMRFLGGRGLSFPESRHMSDRIADHWDVHGFGLWATLGPDGEAVGFTGVCHPLWFPRYAGEVELGWRLARPAWGRGYATRGARLAARAAFEHIDLERLVAFVHPENTRSVAVVERLGMTLDEETTDPTLQHTLDVYSLTRSQAFASEAPAGLA